MNRNEAKEILREIAGATMQGGTPLLPGEVREAIHVLIDNPTGRILTVSDLISELENFNPNAIVCIGDNFNNRVSLSWSSIGEGECCKENCLYVGLNVENEKDLEK